MTVFAFVVSATHSMACLAATNETTTAVSISTLTQAAKVALAAKHPQIDLSTFYLQRMTHNVVFSPEEKREVEAFDLVYRLRSGSAPGVSAKREIVAIHLELDAQAAVRRLLLIAHDGKSTGAIAVPLAPNEDATLVNEGILPPKP